MEIGGLLLSPVSQPRGEVEVAKAQGVEKTGGEGLIPQMNQANAAVVEPDEMPTYTPEGLKPAGGTVGAGLSVKA